LLNFARQIGNAFWSFDCFAIDLNCLEVITDCSFVDIPQCFFDALALFYNEIFLLPGKKGDAIPYFRPPLEPAGINRRYEDAVRVGLLLKNQFPHVDIKVCEVDSIEELAQGIALH
jgi:hypothetical protein